MMAYAIYQMKTFFIRKNDNFFTMKNKNYKYISLNHI